MISPYIRQHLAYCLAGSNDAYYNVLTRSSGATFSTVFVYHQNVMPPYTPTATQQWIMLGSIGGPRGGTNWATRTFCGTMATVFASVIYFSYAWHIGSFDLIEENFASDYPIAFSTYFPVRRNNSANERVIFSDAIIIRDPILEIIEPNMGGRFFWGNVSGESDTYAQPGDWAVSGVTALRLFDISISTFFDATIQSNTIPVNGTIATLVFQGRSHWTFGADSIHLLFTWEKGGVGSLFILTQNNDPLWYTSGQELGGWETIGSGDQFLATIKMHILEGSCNGELS